MSATPTGVAVAPASVAAAPVIARSTAIGALVVAVLAVGAAFLGSYPVYLMSLAMINVIAAVGLNLLTGNSGQISLCHSSFMAIGAYGATLMSARWGVPFWLSIPAGALLAAALGALLGAPASRLRGIYLALATLGFLQIVQIVIEEFAGCFLPVQHEYRAIHYAPRKCQVPSDFGPLAAGYHKSPNTCPFSASSNTIT